MRARNRWGGGFAGAAVSTADARAAKAAFDPAGLLNPGVLIDP